MTPATEWPQLWTLIQRLADRVVAEYPNVNRERFLRLALDILGKDYEPVTGPDPRD